MMGRALALLLALLVASPALAYPPRVPDGEGHFLMPTPVICVQTDGTLGSCGSGGGGDASAVNQTAVQAPAGSDAPKANAIQGITGGKPINVYFGTNPTIANTSFGISGPLPAFAATPTFNLGTLNGAATATLQQSILTTLGSVGDAACDGSAGCSLAGFMRYVAQLGASTSPSSVKLDQTTDGTTNKVTVGPSAASGVAITPSTTTAAASCLVAKASPGNLYAATLHSSVAGWFLFLNLTSAPTSGAAVTPLDMVRYPTAAVDTTVGYSASAPLAFSAGITVCFSSNASPYTYTSSSTADISAKAK